MAGAIARGPLKDHRLFLLSHAEDILLSRAVTIAELHCTVGNQRAQRFYERQAWHWTETSDDQLWCPKPGIDAPSIPTHRYTKSRL